MIRWEAHACLPLHPQADFAPIDRIHAAGVNYVSINIGMDMNPLSQVMSVIGGFRATIAAHPDRYVLASSVDDIERAAADGILAVGFDLEGAMPLLEQSAMVALYRDLGVRQMHFAYNRNNSVADGCHDDERGLTALGRRMVAGRQRGGRAHGLLAHGSTLQPRNHRHLGQTGDLQPFQSAGIGRARAQRHRRADTRVRGIGWRGLRVGCLGLSRNPDAYRGRRRPARRLRGTARGRRTRRHRVGHQLPPGRARRHSNREFRRDLLVAQERRLRPSYFAR